MRSPVVGRREFLRMCGLLGASALVAACAPVEPTPPAEAEAEPTVAEAKPTATKAAEPTVAEAEPKAATLEDYFNAPREETLILDKPTHLEGADNWNPYVTGNATGWGGTSIARDPIVLLNYGTGEIENWMAESMEPNDDASVWTLVLKDGITWNDGTRFTVDDIIFSIELQMNTELLGAHFTYKEWIKSLEKVDDLTMIFNLNKPNFRFAMERFSDQICGYDWIVPKHIWENVEDPLTFKNLDLEKGLPLSTGPYLLYKITTNEVIWVRNDNWWAAKIGFKPLPAPKKVVWSFVGPEEIRVATAIDNGFDALEDITLSSWEALRARNPNWIAFRDELPFAGPDPCARTLTINCAIEPWDDKDMRWMLSYVMDRPQIVEVAYEGTTVPGAYFWPLFPAMQPYTDLCPQEYLDEMAQPNVEKAAAILEEKGYTKEGDYWQKDGKTLSLEIQVHESFTELERIADVFIEQLQRFGIDATKAKLTGQTWGDNFNLGNYEAQSGWQQCGAINEPYSTLRLLANEPAPIGERTTTTNVYRWYNERYTELVNELGTLHWASPRAMELTEEALQILYEELPVIPTAQSRKLTPFNNTYWTNWPSEKNYYHRPVIWCGNFIAVITAIKPAQ